MNIISRIRRIEAALPKPVMGAILLREPGPDATDEAREVFDNEISDAIASGYHVVVQTAGPIPAQRIHGVAYEAEQFNALLAKMALSPASDGHSPDRLSQVIAEISKSGSTLPVVREVCDD